MSPFEKKEDTISISEIQRVVVEGWIATASSIMRSPSTTAGGSLTSSVSMRPERAASKRWDGCRAWARVDVVGVESSGSYGAELSRVLIRVGIPVVEVNRPHPHTRHRRGKSDAVDAEATARKVLAGDTKVVPKAMTGLVEAIHQLKVARDGALKARGAALVQLRDLMITAPADLREVLSKRKTLRGRATLCRRLRPDRARLEEPLEAAKLSLRSLARRITALDEEIADLDLQLEPLVRKAAPRTVELLGVGVGHTTQMLVTASQKHQSYPQRCRIRSSLRGGPDPRILWQDR